MCLAVESPIRPDLTSYFTHFKCESAESIYYNINRILKVKDLVINFDNDFLVQVAIYYYSHNLNYLSYLNNKIHNYNINILGQIPLYALYIIYSYLIIKSALSPDLSNNLYDFLNELL